LGKWTTGMVGAWLELPVWAMLVLLAIGYGAAASVMHWLSFHSSASQWLASFKGLAAPFINAIAVIFALFGGFVAGDVWERSNDAGRLVQGEVDGLLALVDISTAASSDATALRGHIRAYAQSVVKNEWPRMEEGEGAAETEAELAQLLRDSLGSGLASDISPAVERALIDTVLKVRATRSERLSLAADRTAEFKWTTLLLLSLLTQFAIVLVHLDRPRPQIVALAVFSTAAVVALGLVAIQERPFAVPLQVSPVPFEEVVRLIPPPA
jgi:hypothetical protein